MDKARLKHEIERLTEQLERMKAATPAHESGGFHSMAVLRLEDELDEKKKALRDDGRGA